MRFSADKLKRVQTSRLQKVLRHAITHSPYYRQKYRSINPSQFNLADLAPTTKDEIRENFDAAVTDERLKLANLQAFIADTNNLGKWYCGEFAVTQTSGSQGAPLVIVQHRRCIQLMFALMAARSSVAKPTLVEGLRRLFSPRKVAAISFRRGFYPSGMTLEYMQELLGSLVHVTRLASTQPDLIARLNKLQPTNITANASVLEALALNEEPLQLTQLKYMTSSSEELSEGSRQRIEARFKAPVFDHYGAGECLVMADSCAACRKLHVNADWSIVEVVDNDYQPVPAGTTGTKVLVTNLANYAQPFIRYEISDCIALAAHNRCPLNPMPQIERIEGRASDLLCVYEGGSKRFISGIMFHQVFSAMRGVREWRVIQPERNRLEILLQLLDASKVPGSEVERQLRDRLREFGFPESVQVDLDFVPELAPDKKTGKMRRIINEIGWPDEITESKPVAMPLVSQE